MMSFINFILRARLTLISIALCGALVFLSVPLALSFNGAFSTGVMMSPGEITEMAHFIVGFSVTTLGASFIFGCYCCLSGNVSFWRKVTEDFLFVFYVSLLSFISALIVGLIWFDFEPSFAGEFIGITIVMAIFSFQNTYKKYLIKH